MKENQEKHVWILTRTEYAGQCTGFGSETVLLGIFDKKPDMKTVAPYLGRSLSQDMGEAIAQVCELIDKGTLYRDYDYSLEKAPLNSPLER